MTWRCTEYEDLHRIAVEDDCFGADARFVLPDTEQTRELLRNDVRTWVAVDGELLAIVGVASDWKGVGTVWTLIAEPARQRGVALTRGVRRLLDELHERRGFWRLQATVVHGDVRARDWIMQLGFNYEGTMLAYGPDRSTHDLFSSVRY